MREDGGDRVKCILVIAVTFSGSAANTASRTRALDQLLPLPAPAPDISPALPLARCLYARFRRIFPLAPKQFILKTCMLMSFC